MMVKNEASNARFVINMVYFFIFFLEVVLSSRSLFFSRYSFTLSNQRLCSSSTNREAEFGVVMASERDEKAAKALQSCYEIRTENSSDLTAEWRHRHLRK